MKALRYITAVFAIVALASCSNDDMDWGGFVSDPDAVRINATVGDHLTRSNPIDEDGADPSRFNIGDRIEVRTEEQGYVVYVFDGIDWNPEGSDYLKWNKETHRFSAYYPAGIYNILEDQSSLENLQKSDLMEAEASLSKNSTGHISLNFKRRLARIVISKIIDWGTQYDDTYSVTDLRVHTIMEKQVKPYIGKDNYYAIVNSDNVAEPRLTFLTIKVQSSRPGSEEITYTITGIPLHEAGKSYIYELKIGKDKAEISNVIVEDWETGGVISPEVNPGEAPDYKTSVADGVTTYHVYTAKGLQDVNAIMSTSSVTKETLASNIKLEGNITLPAVAEGESNWTPIGFYSNDNNNDNDAGFTGVFDGNGYTITGLVINSENYYQGLFGFLDNGGLIKNLTLANCSIKGGSYTGAFVGWSANSSIENCHLIATTGKEVLIESESLYTGGIVGQSFGTVSDCSLTADGGSVTIASTADHVGGIVGNAGRDSYTSGCQVLALNGGAIAITGDARTGGIVGDVVNGDNAEMMSDCHITNNDGTITVTGAKDVGGAVGYIHSISNSFVQNCNVTGVQVTGTAQVGGFTGRLNDESTIVGSNTVKDCTITGTDETTVKWDVGRNDNTSHSPEITDGGGNILNGIPTK